MKIWTSSVTK